jgi:hypothetical protein
MLAASAYEIIDDIRKTIITVLMKGNMFGGLKKNPGTTMEK